MIIQENSLKGKMIMLNALIRRFVPDAENLENPAVRAAYGVLAGVLGIFFNFLLFAIKLPIGLLTGSIAITSDAFNNISDMGSSVVALIGAKLSARHADSEHPFGHGRLEYIAALIVAALIFLVAFELIKESVGRFFGGVATAVSPVLLVVLALSILVKLYMYRYNRRIGEKIHAPVLKAAASDSLNDVFVTLGVVVSAIASQFVDFPVDAVAGLVVAVIILRAGYGVAKDTIDLLLGGKPDPVLLRKLRDEILATENVVGIHDLIVHDYGPGRAMASVHAEVPNDIDVTRMHELIDETERRVLRDLHVPLVIHMDPIALNDPETQQIALTVARVLGSVNPNFSFHDFRMTKGEHNVNLIFDLVVPVSMTAEERQAAVLEIKDLLKAHDARYSCVIQVDSSYE